MKALKKTEIEEKLEAVEAKIKAMNFDNNGNPVDWQYAELLYKEQEELEEEYFNNN